jgi:MmeI, target recognition domain
VANEPHCFKGSVPLGDGFFLNKDEVESLRSSDSRYKDVTFLYMNGQELNNSPILSPGRWIIYFRNWPLDKCKEYPLCLEIAYTRVKPERDKIKPTNNMAKQRRDLWWKFTGPTIELYNAIQTLERVLVASAISKHHAFAFVPANYIYSNALNVFANDSDEVFSLLQSNIHASWALAHGSKLEDRPRYNVTDCFQTFPFPKDVSRLRLIGKHYDEHRSQLMRKRLEGLTKTYNRLHDLNEKAEDIQRLRELQVEMDQTVAVAYDWHNLDLDHGFHETKMGMRYTIGESARREILQRLLKLNRERYEEEIKLGLRKEKKGRKKTATKRKAAKLKISPGLSLFSDGNSERG